MHIRRLSNMYPEGRTMDYTEEIEQQMNLTINPSLFNSG